MDGSNIWQVYLLHLCWASIPSFTVKAYKMEGETSYTSTTSVQMTAEETSPSILYQMQIV